MKLETAASLIERASHGDLTRHLARLEMAYRGSNAADAARVGQDRHVDTEVLRAALVLKAAAGQIHMVIHAFGILVALPHILEAGEHVEALSLGAGNTGRPVDLETDRRLIEFKFIQWRGGAESIRQNSLFKDFYTLAEMDSTKRRALYVLELKHPLKFLQGRRALSSVLSRHEGLRSQFYTRYGDRFKRVHEYYAYRRDRVALLELPSMLTQFGDMDDLESAVAGQDTMGVSDQSV